MSPTKTGNVLSWASDVDLKALEQARRAADLPFVKGHLALMPDAHWGLGATIGSVIPTEGAVIPAAVGVDIGCGMAAAEMPFTSGALSDNLDGLLSSIGRAVPAGVGQGHQHTAGRFVESQVWDDAPPLSDKQRKKVVSQLGSLGSGNHFIEVCLDERDVVWVVLHSGSRGIGNQLAQFHINRAKGLMEDYFISLEDPNLAYLVENTDEFNEYIEAMMWAQDYAATNREVMLDAVLRELADHIGGDRDYRANEDLAPVQTINCHHNFTQMEHHHGQDLWITRKGAIRARQGDLGVIPGSMGAASYVVEGLGSSSSYHSCSHGAGRTMSRKRARSELDVGTLRSAMEGKTWNESAAEALLDEDPRAYKDIDQVMADQRDLVSVRHSLRQILNYKGL